MQNDLLGIKDLNTVVVIPFTSNLVTSEYEPNILFRKEDTGLTKDSVAVIHLIGAVNKFSFEKKDIKNFRRELPKTRQFCNKTNFR